MKKRWKYVLHVSTGQGVADKGYCQKLRCLDTCNEPFLKMKKELLVNATQVQRRAELLSMMRSIRHFYLDG